MPNFCKLSALICQEPAMLSQPNHHKPLKVINFRRSPVSENTNVTLVLNWYEKTGNDLIGEETISDLTLDNILGLFDAPFWNKNFQCWAVDENHIATIQPHVKHKLDMEKYAYFIEAYTPR